MNDGVEKVECNARLEEYKVTVLNEDGKSIHHRGWDAADMTAFNFLNMRVR